MAISTMPCWSRFTANRKARRSATVLQFALAAKPIRWLASPDPKHISTIYVERHNLSVRMTNRRFTRLTNAFSKKIENHAAAVALGYFAYNFIKIHRTLRTTPAMAAGVTGKLWEVADLVALWESYEQGTEMADNARGYSNSPSRNILP